MWVCACVCGCVGVCVGLGVGVCGCVCVCGCVWVPLLAEKEKLVLFTCYFCSQGESNVLPCWNHCLQFSVQKIILGCIKVITLTFGRGGPWFKYLQMIFKNVVRSLHHKNRLSIVDDASMQWSTVIQLHWPCNWSQFKIRISNNIK